MEASADGDLPPALDQEAKNAVEEVEAAIEEVQALGERAEEEAENAQKAIEELLERLGEASDGLESKHGDDAPPEVHAAFENVVKRTTAVGRALDEETLAVAEEILRLIADTDETRRRIEELASKLLGYVDPPPPPPVDNP